MLHLSEKKCHVHIKIYNIFYDNWVNTQKIANVIWKWVQNLSFFGIYNVNLYCKYNINIISFNVKYVLFY